MMKPILSYILIIIVALGIASCSSTKKIQHLPAIGELKGTDYIEKVIGQSPHWQNITAKIAVQDVATGGKNTQLSGTLRIKRDEVIQLSVAPLWGIEVFRIEFTPEGLLLLDRWNKRYIEVSFREIGELLNLDISFDILQSLLLNELFLPEKTDLNVSDASKFNIEASGDEVLLKLRKRKRLSFDFWTSAESGFLKRTRIGLRGTDYALDWKYSEFNTVGNKQFPKHMLLDINGLKQPVLWEIKFSRLSDDKEWNHRTEISSKYKKIELQEFLKLVSKK